MVIVTDFSTGDGDVVFKRFLKSELDKLYHTVVIEYSRLSSSSGGSQVYERRRSVNDAQVFKKPCVIRRGHASQLGFSAVDLNGEGLSLPGAVSSRNSICGQMITNSLPMIADTSPSTTTLLLEAEVELQHASGESALPDKFSESSSEESPRRASSSMETSLKKETDPVPTVSFDSFPSFSGDEGGDSSPHKSVDIAGETANHSNDDDDEESGTSDAEVKVYKVLDSWYVRLGSRLDRQKTSMSREWNALSRKSSFDGSIGLLESHGDWDHSYGLRERISDCLQRYMLHPNAKKALLWEIVALVFIGFDVIAIPFNVFEPQEIWFTILVRTVLRCFWTFDILFMFFVGYTSVEGSMVMLPAQVAKRYLRSRFFLDIALVSLSWIGAFVDNDVKDSVQVITGIDIFEGVQLLRIHRLSNLWRLGDQMFLYVQSEEKLLVAYISMIICLLLGIIHIIACMWFWVSDADFISPADSLFEAYMQCIHIALALLVGEHVVTKYRNIQQRCFTVSTLFFGFILCAGFVGALTTAMTRLQNVSRKRAGMFSALHRFLTQHSVSAELSVRLNRNARFTLNQHKLHIQERDVELLHHVSDNLKAELHYEIHSPRLMVHPFLQVFNRLQFRAIQNICDKAVMPLNVSRGDILFTVLELPHRPSMYFCKPGTIHYFVAEFRGSYQMAYQCVCGNVFKEDSHFCMKCGAKRQEDIMPQKFRGTALKEERCLAEASVWTTWTHTGTAKAVKESQLLSLDAQSFGHIMRKVHLPHVWQYAVKFVEHLNNSLLPSDLGPDTWEWRKMVTTVFTEQDGEFQQPPEWDSNTASRRRSSLMSHLSAKSGYSVPSLPLVPAAR